MSICEACVQLHPYIDSVVFDSLTLTLSLPLTLTAPPLQGIYAASKAATKALTDSLRRELLPFDLSVSLVEPAYVATELLSTATVSSTTAICSNKAIPVESSRTGTNKVGEETSPTNKAREQDVLEAKSRYAHLYSERVEREIEWNVSLAETPACTTWAIKVRHRCNGCDVRG